MLRQLKLQRQGTTFPESAPAANPVFLEPTAVIQRKVLGKHGTRCAARSSNRI